ncbi:hypothetical protein E4U42_006584 [Claviceps africana]|uniref:ZZ-type domain-containing protein n=1 Tax=Claviceps africana TaxID=83212 RepID=A0A8K0NGL9_9HYPO|nr:hypothetical protein E4U42_006584 [Claviceps africana]
MSSNYHAGPDAIVTVKVTYRGVPFRAKLPLREMVPRVLEQHLRSFLPIPAGAKVMIERYSDSAGAYVMLDASNMAVYKQLYRAAKAKSKLKLRVSILPENDAASPEPDTLQDAPKPVQPATTSRAESIHSNPTSVASASSSRTTLSKKYDATLLQEAARLIQDHQADFDNRVRQVMRSTDELASLTSKMASCQPFMTISEQLPKPSDPPLVCPALASRFTVCCNSCEKNIPDAHYHCSTCNDGDFDLCESCVGQGIICYSDDHWLIKRSMSNGQIVNSTTEIISPKLKTKAKFQSQSQSATRPATDLAKPSDDPTWPAGVGVPVVESTNPSILPVDGPPPSIDMRTCNQCVRELPECEFLHCTTCEDYDLCQLCFMRDAHGHHPKHGFAAAVPETQMPAHIRVKMSPGRNQIHHAICDGCDTYIAGVRHKCLDCPDWDYCGECVQNAHFVHPSHRFVAVYEPLSDVHAAAVAQPVHVGICCDGPLCSATRAARATSTYIRGIRYKCAVCHDLDFCANCEASPSNEHNKTHPLLKFKTPVRHVTVTTSGEHEDGKRMPTMGDRLSANSKPTETVPASPTNAINAVQTVIDVKPVEAVVPPPPPPPPRPAKEPVSATTPQSKPMVTTATEVELKEGDLRAVFLRDSVADGTIFPPNHVFQQTWVLRNDGKVTWPAGCSVKFVGGDYMGHVDSAHPAGVSELVSASESSICHKPLTPGEEWAFTTSLRTPSRPGRVISYWRLATPDGMRFGHRLWCEVRVRGAANPEVKHSAPSTDPVTTVPTVKTEQASDDNQASSMMIFPKLENESAGASVLKETRTETTEPVSAVPKGVFDKNDDEDDEDDGWDGSENEDGFMTDEEYDILDASDEEFLEEQKKTPLNK